MGRMRHQPCKEWRESLGAFALGHLEGRERARIQAHLDACPGCREEVRSLAHVGELLSLADAERVGSRPMPRRNLWPGIADAVRRGRRRRWTTVGAAAAIALAIVASVVLLARPGGDEAVDVTFASAPQQVEGSAALRPKPWGTQIDLEITGLPADHYNVWLERRGGDRAPAGSFTGMEDRTLTMRLASSLDLTDARAIGVSTQDGATVMRQEIR